MNVNPDYQDALAKVEVNSQARDVLRREFPGVRFHVESETTRDSVDVRVEWRDGPRPEEAARALRGAHIRSRDWRPIGEIRCERRDADPARNSLMVNASRVEAAVRRIAQN